MANVDKMLRVVASAMRIDVGSGATVRQLCDMIADAHDAPRPGDGQRYRMTFDGACRGNPGPAAVGGAIVDPDGIEIATFSERIGHATNNVAEYCALVRGLELCIDNGLVHVDIAGDSKLVVNQVRGVWATRSPQLAKLRDHVRAQLVGMDVAFEHVPRAQNKRADALANAAYDE